ncbi:unnamed protein product [Rotaria sordida]|uniref:Uncharacterized protein n=1 Tax=Rotaria sordida TaxID=392033 RepID=A0A815L8F2_9BILA|nr:unnamed protein product [Rotaria sordida]CAF1404435.1 unnamed protein product [Rotaria sordida]
MPELSGQCEHELCSKQSHSKPIRLYQCSYHCRKMLCIEHLCEHEQYIEKHMHHRNQLEELFNNYSVIFDEDECLKEIKRLQKKLEEYQRLCGVTKNLLSIHSSHSSMENNEKFQKVIEAVKQAIKQENQSKSFSRDIDTKIESVTSCQEENRLTISHGMYSQFKNNNEGDAPQRMVNHPIDNIDRDRSNESEELILPTDDNGATDRVLGPIVVHYDGHDEHDPTAHILVAMSKNNLYADVKTDQRLSCIKSFFIDVVNGRQSKKRSLTNEQCISHTLSFDTLFDQILRIEQKTFDKSEVNHQKLIPSVRSTNMDIQN